MIKEDGTNVGVTQSVWAKDSPISTVITILRRDQLMFILGRVRYKRNEHEI